MDFESETLVTAPITGRPYADRGAEEYGLIVGALTQGAHPGGYNGQDAYSGHLVTHSLSADGFDASEDGTGRGTPLVPCCITGDKTHTLDSFSSGRATEDSTGRGCPIVAFDCKASGRNGFGIGEQSPTLRSMGHKDTHQNAGGQVAVLSRMAVRRLTPRECERLQGVPDGFTLVSRNGKPMADGPRYKMLGNGFAVPVVRWIGERLAKAVK
jgi:DNA (cytosine-5)-methyltransferase 1